tara:strand:- start:2448 stop:3638 length:1191 start_codon:yes stop_codon:yes gene_type:complete
MIETPTARTPGGRLEELRSAARTKSCSPRDLHRFNELQSLSAQAWALLDVAETGRVLIATTIDRLRNNAKSTLGHEAWLTILTTADGIRVSGDDGEMPAAGDIKQAADGTVLRAEWLAWVDELREDSCTPYDISELHGELEAMCADLRHAESAAVVDGATAALDGSPREGGVRRDLEASLATAVSAQDADVATPNTPQLCNSTRARASDSSSSSGLLLLTEPRALARALGAAAIADVEAVLLRDRAMRCDAAADRAVGCAVSAVASSLGAAGAANAAITRHHARVAVAVDHALTCAVLAAAVSETEACAADDAMLTAGRAAAAAAAAAALDHARARAAASQRARAEEARARAATHQRRLALAARRQNDAAARDAAAGNYTNLLSYHFCFSSHRSLS